MQGGHWNWAKARQTESYKSVTFIQCAVGHLLLLLVTVGVADQIEAFFRQVVDQQMTGVGGIVIRQAILISICGQAAALKAGCGL